MRAKHTPKTSPEILVKFRWIRPLLAIMLLGVTNQSAWADADYSSGRILKYQTSIEHPGNIAGLEILPKSSFVDPQTSGMKVHTHLRVLVPAAGQGTEPASAAAVAANLKVYHNAAGSNVVPQDRPGFNANTPASLACVYQLVPQPGDQPAGCNPNYTSINPAGGDGAIALVDAYD